jgi:hypothetical protein
LECVNPAQRWTALAIVMAAAAFLLGAPGAPRTTQADQVPVVFSIDSARVRIGATSEAHMRVSAPAPGVAGYVVDVHYDPAHITNVGCQPLSTCTVNVLGPQTVRFAGASLRSWLGENTQLGTLTFQVTGGAGQTSLTIDGGSLDAYDELDQTISNVDTKDGVVDIMGSVNSSDLNCSGGVTVADALVVLKYVGEGKYADLPGCTPPGNTINGALWGDVNTDGVVDARDALQILLGAANLT